MDTTINLSGCQITEELYSGTRTLVYRGVRELDQQPVVIKLLRNEYPSFNELVQFRNQYTIAKNLNSPAIISTYSLEPHNNGYALVMEDFGGISLNQWIGKESVLPLGDFLRIAIDLCYTLDILYQERIIHKDIKPANILINPETKQIKLIDFSIASLLPRETQEIQNANSLEGTLAYLSPEQTGRMNRGIDYRSDFYALGVTFYELLTGQLPFISHDPLELVHCHLAKTPTLVHEVNPNIPLVLSKMISKLMAKNAEDRYQSALGIQHDLELCGEQLQKTGQIIDFAIGQRDRSDRFTIPEKLYGRESEVDQLLAAFDRVSRGSAEMMLVAGFSGIGKTAVINEVHKPIVRQRGYFIKGKYDQFQRNIPFSAFVQAFRDLMGQLLSESDAELEIWRTKILSALGDNGQVIIEVVPELALIIGQQPAVTELSGTAAQNRFNLLFKKFFQVFTTPEHPLVLFIDDLQWADSASLNLMQLLMEEAEAKYLLFLGAYRDNEVNPIHPLMQTLANIQKSAVRINQINLMPLSRKSINHLVANTLSCAPELAMPLTELVMSKTKGNPFFSTQLLKSFYEDGLIRFNSPKLRLPQHQGSFWECDIGEIRALTLTEDVTEFMAQQLQKLSPPTQSILSLAACIGAEFDLATLAIVSEQTEQEVSTALWEALQEELVLPLNKVYRFFQDDTALPTMPQVINIPYRFLHDRVQQAAYSLIPEHEKQATSYRIGKLLGDDPAKREERLFAIVTHLNLGRSLIHQDFEREELAQLNLLAGRKAQAATAYTAAIEYLATGIELLAADSWHTQFDLTLALHNSAVEATYLNTEFDRAETLAEVVLQSTHSLPEQVKIYEVKIQILTARNQLPEAIALGLKVLDLLGITFPAQPSQLDIAQELQKTQLLWQEIPVTDLIDLPSMTDPDKLVAMQILLNISASTYIVSPLLYLLIVFQQVNLSVKYGTTAASTYAYAAYGLILCGIVGDISLGYQFGHIALDLLQKLNARELQSKIYVIVNCFIQHWQEHLRTTIQPLQDAYFVGLETGDLEFAAYSASQKTFHLYFAGEELSTVEQDITLSMAGVKKIKRSNVVNYYQVFQQAIHQLRYIPKEPRNIEEGRVILEISEDTQDINVICYFYCHKMILHYLFGENHQAVINAELAENYLEAMTALFFVPVFYFYDSLTKLAVYPDRLPSEQENILIKVIANQQKMQSWADHAPMNHLHKFELVEAERYRVIGNKAEAIDLYDKAIAGAKANQYTQEEALANELAAKFYLDWGKEKVAAGYMQEAYYCYARWGAKAKIDDLITRYAQLLEPILQEPETSFDPLATQINIINTNTESSSTGIHNSLDFLSVLKAAQAISSEIKLDKLLQQLTQIILQNSGADKCALVLPQDEIWRVRAISTLKFTEIHSEPLADQLNVPIKIIQFIKRTQAVVLINNLETDLPVIDDYLTQYQPKSILGLPIINQGCLIGIIYLENRLTPGLFTRDRLTIINFLCNQAAISLANAQLYQDLQNLEAQEHQKATELEQTLAVLQLQNKKLAFRADVDAGLTKNDSLGEMLQSSTEAIVKHLDAAFARIWTLNSQENVLELQASAGQYTHLDGSHACVPVGKFKIGLIAEESCPHLTNDVLNDPRVGNKEWAEREGMIAFAGYPLIVENQIMGVMAMFARHTLDDEILQLLSSVADEIASAIKRKNIQKVLQESEIELQQKSQQIEQAFQQLQQTQLQMVQSEKMSALGNLVAGVAHEINNPVGFLSGNITPALDYINDLFGLIDLFQEKYPQLHPEIQEEIESIELDYIREDLPKLIGSMREGVKRIKDISTSLRTFSRDDSDRPVPCNIHDGIDSTIMILKHRLKADEARPEIEVIKNYGKLPKIECYAGQLNQVFMNILANAIEALDESTTGRSFAEIQANPHQITVTTKLEDQQVKIAIADNGKGMSLEVQQKVFENLFTTKGVGKGTGLGLAIARQIIEEKHNGTIDLISELGQGTEFIITLPIISKLP